MRKVILVLAVMALSGNAMGQSRCADENGRPIECPTLIKVIPEINPDGPDCKSCPTNLNFRKDWLYRDFFFKNILYMPIAVAANTIKSFNKQ